MIDCWEEESAASSKQKSSNMHASSRNKSSTLLLPPSLARAPGTTKLAAPKPAAGSPETTLQNVLVVPSIDSMHEWA
jgi:hypothetical protein